MAKQGQDQAWQGKTGYGMTGLLGPEPIFCDRLDWAGSSQELPTVLYLSCAIF